MAEKVVAIVVAAGGGTRMGGPAPKQFLALGGRPILSWALAAAQAAACVDAIVVVCPAGWEDHTRRHCLAPFGLDKVRAVVAGGAQRQDSVAAGLEAALGLGAHWLLIHDGARPLARPELFAAVLEGARAHGAAIAGVPVVDTIKRSADGRLVQATEDRRPLWRAQTPQGFRAELLAQALQAARAAGWSFTDEAGLFERLGREVGLIMGRADNIKITTPEDLALARALLGPAAIRVGQGLDYHRLAPGRPLVLGGVRLEHELGLLGHSDADVLTHAVMDGLLAAAGLGDIGRLFPDHDPAFKDADSLALLGRVVALLAEHGWRPAQIAVTLVAQGPKIAPHAPAMAQNLARVAGLSPGQVNVAATTTEAMGAIGRGEGMSALAVVTITPLEGAAEPAPSRRR